ncbi:retrotransposon protein, putative, ty1-copia subclass [Tanacetum coccineum]
MAIQGGRIQKANKRSQNAIGKGKGKGNGKDKSYISKTKNPKPSAKEHPTKNDACRHYCKEVGYCKRNCPAYLVELIKKKKQVGTAKEEEKLKQGALYLYVGNDVRVQVEAIGSYDLVLPNGLVFKNEVENQLEKTIKAIRSDRGGEYISQEFKDYLKACGIVQQPTSPYTPQHNRVSERRNQSATRILNMVPTKKVDKTPYELWYGKVPNLSYLKVWGFEALEKQDTLEKLQQRPIKFVARYAEFLEKNLISQEVSRRAGELEEIQDEDTSPSKNTSECLWRLKVSNHLKRK